jgi:hypothetical protein
MDTFEAKFCQTLGMKYCKGSKTVSDSVLDFVRNRKMEFQNKKWTFGSSPNYEFSNQILIENEVIAKVLFETTKGKIIRQSLSGDARITKLDFRGHYHSFDELFPILSKAFGKSLSINDISNICYQFFNEERRA